MRFNRHKIVLPVTIKVSRCLLPICVLARGLLIMNWYGSTGLTPSSMVRGRPSMGFKPGEGESRLVFSEDHPGCCMGMGVGLATAGTSVINDIPSRE